jgi:hypothetical protein
MCSNRKILIIIAVLFFFFPQKVEAAFDLNISSPSATLITSNTQEVDLSLNITDLPGESYFRVALQKEGGGSYYGYIKNNNNEWSKIQTLSGDCLGYYKVSDLKTTLVGLKFKIGDDISIDNGNYNLKAHKFTKTCSSYSEGSNVISMVITLPTPTPTQAPTTAPTASPAPTSKPQTPTPTAKPTIAPTVKPTASSSPEPEETETPEPLLESTSTLAPIITTQPRVLGDNTTKKKMPLVSYIFIVLGLGFLGYVGYMLYNVKECKK